MVVSTNDFINFASATHTFDRNTGDQIVVIQLGGIEVFFHIYMKKVVLHEEDKSREHNQIHHDNYAMEMSDEYIDSSTINKSQSEKLSNQEK